MAEKKQRLENFAGVGRGHAFDLNMRAKVTDRWADQINDVLLKNSAKILTRTYNDPPLRLRVNEGEGQAWEADLNPQKTSGVSRIVNLGFNMEDPTLREFAGVKRTGDDSLSVFPGVGWAAGVKGVVSGFLSGITIGAGVSWAESLRRIQAFTAEIVHYTQLRQNATTNLEALQPELKNPTFIPQLMPGGGGDVNQTQYVAIVQDNISRLTNQAETAQNIIATATQEISRLYEASNVMQRLFSLIPSASTMLEVADSAVRSITEPLTPILQSRGFSGQRESGVSLAIAGGTTIGILGYGLARYFSRKEATRLSQENARNKIRTIAVDVANRVMADMLASHADFHQNEKDKFAREQGLLMRRQLEQSIEISEIFKQQRRQQDEALLQQLIIGYKQLANITPFQVLWYVVDRVRSGLIHPDAGTNVLRLFGPEVVAFVDNAVFQKQRDAQQMKAAVDRLGSAGWTKDAMDRERDWDAWMRNPEMFQGVKEVANVFAKSQGRSLLSAAPQNQEESVAAAVVQDSMFTSDIESDQKGCLVISDRVNTMEPGGRMDMWFEKDTDMPARGQGDPATTKHFERATIIFHQMLEKTKWNRRGPATAEILNSYQRLWLYRWMGPACTRWLTISEQEAAQYKPPAKEPSIIKPERVYNTVFVTLTCRSRFAFLKSMLYHSLLFLFVRPREAMELMTTKHPNSCIARALVDGGKGQGMLILDNCRPGHVRIVGKNPDDQKVNELIDCAEFVQIDENLDGSWTFNHQRILYGVVQRAYRDYGIELLSNNCWKSATTGSDDPSEQQFMQESPNGTSGSDNLEAFNTGRYLYGMSRSLAIRAKLMQSKELEKLVQDAEIRYYFTLPHRKPEDPKRRLEHMAAVKRDVVESERRNTQGESWPTIDAQIAMIRSKISQNTPDSTFRSAATMLHIFSDVDVDAYTQHTQTLLNDETQWREMFESSGYSKCNRPAAPFIINTLCVNPFAVCVYEKKDRHPREQSRLAPSQTKPTDVYMIFGDAWFIQPILESLQKTGLAYKVKRFTAIQKWFQRSPEVQDFEKNRKYLQDVLYSNYWHSMLGVRAQ